MSTTLETGTLEAGIEAAAEDARNGAATVSVDEFQALEQKVLQTVELIKMERAARSAIQIDLNAAHAEIAALLAQGSAAKAALDAAHTESAALREQLLAAASSQHEAAGLQQKLTGLEQKAAAMEQETFALHREREATRLRVNSMLSSLDDLLG